MFDFNALIKPGAQEQLRIEIEPSKMTLPKSP